MNTYYRPKARVSNLDQVMYFLPLPVGGGRVIEEIIKEMEFYQQKQLSPRQRQIEKAYLYLVKYSSLPLLGATVYALYKSM